MASESTLVGMVFGPNGEDRLCLYYVPCGDGSDFESLSWEKLEEGQWRSLVAITREQFQGAHAYTRWVSELFSLDPQRGWAAIKVAEGNRPAGPHSVRYDYSWRTWDLVKNREVGRLKDCDDPFEPL
jgi:hypothetical protein